MLFNPPTWDYFGGCGLLSIKRSDYILFVTKKILNFLISKRKVFKVF